MIATPKFSDILFDTPIMGGIGYTIGLYAGVNAQLSATVLAVASFANVILFQMANRWIRPLLNVSPEAIYTGTNTIVTVITTLAARQFELISRRMTCVCIFASLGILAARLRILAD